MTRLSALVLSFLIALLVCDGAWGPRRDAAESKSNAPSIGIFDNPRDSAQLRVNPDLYLRPDLSVGEATLLPRDPMQSWKAGHARLWFALPHSESSARLFIQSGLGFLQADPLLQPNGLGLTSSLLVPFGLGFDYPWTAGKSVTTVLSLDMSDIRAGGQTGTHLSPGLLFGIHF